MFTNAALPVILERTWTLLSACSIPRLIPHEMQFSTQEKYETVTPLGEDRKRSST